MARVEQPAKIASLPADDQIYTSIQCSRHPIERSHRDAIEASVFDPDDHGRRHPCKPREILLPEPLPDPNGTQGRSDALMVHGLPSSSQRIIPDLSAIVSRV
jgi:hypothetical protein